jgi:prepilin-type N-terminal cleavage/methylation domain-containing protein
MSARLSHRREGFTLIELLIVVVIIGILAAIAIPKFANTKDQAYGAQMRSDLKSLVTVQESFFFDNTRYGDLADLTPDPYAYRMSTPSVQATLQIVRAAAQTGWYATATDNRMAVLRTCGVYGGAVGGLPAQLQGAVEGAVTCW